ncbi:MAG: hypothetical protein WDM70_04395 [Nitrosomonadales bacterium]
MRNILLRLGMTAGLTFAWVESSYALDSYRFLHVTIETPWAIFLFLLGTIFIPFVLMAVLVWRYDERKVDPEPDRKPPTDIGSKE